MRYSSIYFASRPIYDHQGSIDFVYKNKPKMYMYIPYVNYVPLITHIDDIIQDSRVIKLDSGVLTQIPKSGMPPACVFIPETHPYFNYPLIFSSLRNHIMEVDPSHTRSQIEKIVGTHILPLDVLNKLVTQTL